MVGSYGAAGRRGVEQAVSCGCCCQSVKRQREGPEFFSFSIFGVNFLAFCLGQKRAGLLEKKREVSSRQNKGGLQFLKIYILDFIG